MAYVGEFLSACFLQYEIDLSGQIIGGHLVIAACD